MGQPTRFPSEDSTPTYTHKPRTRRGRRAVAWGGGVGRTLDSCDSLKSTLLKSPSAMSAPEMSKPAADVPSILHWCNARVRVRRRGGVASERWGRAWAVGPGMGGWAGHGRWGVHGQNVAGSLPRASRTANHGPRSPAGRETRVSHPAECHGRSGGLLHGGPLRWASAVHVPAPSRTRRTHSGQLSSCRWAGTCTSPAPRRAVQQ